VADVDGEPFRGGGDPSGDAGVGWVDHVEAASVLRGAVGVDRDGGVGVCSVADRCPLVDARPPGCVCGAGEDDGGAGSFEDVCESGRDVEVEGGFGVAVCAFGAGCVACLEEAAGGYGLVDLGEVFPVVRVVARVDRDDLPGQREATGMRGRRERRHERHDNQSRR
jgi:hypothetical protein